MLDLYLHALIYLFLGIPLSKALSVLALNGFSVPADREKWMIRLIRFTSPIELILALSFLVIALLGPSHLEMIMTSKIPYIPKLSVLVDFRTSLFLLLTQTIMMFVIGFSIRYLHRENSYLKYFGLLFLFNFAINILLLSNSISWFLMGWEILGLTSVLLISFYSQRESTVKNSLRIFGFYKIADVLLFAGFAMFIHQTGSFFFTDLQNLSPGDLSWTLGFITFAVMFKVGLLPVPWLPRAMEGPTVSSAIFYGGLATHVPLLFLLRISEGLQMVPAVKWTLIVLLIIIASMASIMARIQVDAKNSQAFSSLCQFAVVIIEILAGWTSLATLHIITHSLYRLTLFLRTPSLLYDYHQLAGFRGQVFEKSGVHFEFALPEKIRKNLYFLSLKEFLFIPWIYQIFDKILFLDLNLRKRSRLVVLAGNLVAWCALLLLQSLYMNEVHISLLLLFIPWVLAVLSLALRLTPYRYIFVMSLCASSLIGILFYAEHLVNIWETLEIELIIYAALAIFLLFPMIPKSKNLPRLGPIAFAIILWLVGVPGPGTFIIFENIFHHLFAIDLFVAIGSFIVLSVYVYSVVRFYSLTNCNQILREKFYV